MADRKKERRQFDRYKTKVEIYFDFAYDVETKVEFAFIDQKGKSVLSKKYPAVSQNVSVGGLCFICHRKVKQGNLLHLEVYLPSSEKPIYMQGEVEWCKPTLLSFDDPASDKKKQRSFEVGVRLMFVNGESVPDSIYYDKMYKVDWSIVLERVFGSYGAFVRGKDE